MNEEEQITVRHAPERNRFEVELGNEFGVLTYEIDGPAITFLRTFVPEAHRNKGVGALLVREGVDYARRNELEIDPRCPFVEAWMRRHPE